MRTLNLNNNTAPAACATGIAKLQRTKLAKAIQQAYTHGHDVDVRYDGSIEFGWLADRAQVAWHCEALQPDQKPPTLKFIRETLKEVADHE